MFRNKCFFGRVLHQGFHQEVDCVQSWAYCQSSFPIFLHFLPFLILFPSFPHLFFCGSSVSSLPPLPLFFPSQVPPCVPSLSPLPHPLPLFFPSPVLMCSCTFFPSSSSSPLLSLTSSSLCSFTFFPSSSSSPSSSPHLFLPVFLHFLNFPLFLLSLLSCLPFLFFPSPPHLVFLFLSSLAQLPQKG